jgi:protein-tyrosine-phosphatase
MGHLWAQLAAGYYQIDGISCYSGGTEDTAFNPRAVKALVAAGMDISIASEGNNPLYRIMLPGVDEKINVFSKKYTDPPNPTEDFFAVMTCNDADEACPIVYGALSRHSIQYKDPKESDGTPEESQRYAERSAQIAREMLYLFSIVGD